MVGSLKQVICWRGKKKTLGKVSRNQMARLGYARSFSNKQPLQVTELCQVWAADPCHGGPKETNTGQVFCNLEVCVRAVGPHMGLSIKQNKPCGSVTSFLLRLI